MLRGEIEVLTAITMNKRTPKQITSSKIARSAAYVKSTIESLLHRGYISGNKSDGYQVTTKGAQALMEYDPSSETLTKLAHHRLQRELTTRAKKAIEMIESLGIEYDVKVEELRN